MGIIAFNGTDGIGGGYADGIFHEVLCRPRVISNTVEHDDIRLLHGCDICGFRFEIMSVHSGGSQNGSDLNIASPDLFGEGTPLVHRGDDGDRTGGAGCGGCAGFWILRYHIARAQRQRQYRYAEYGQCAAPLIPSQRHLHPFVW